MGYGTSRGYKCVKYCFFIFNVLFWLLGCSVLGVGIWLHVTKGSFATLTPSLNYITVTALCIAAGTIVLVVGFFGCCGAIMENKCMLMTYFLFVCAIFIMETVLGILAFVNRQAIHDTVKKELLLGIQKKYPRQSSNSEQGLVQGWDSWQSLLHCCGVTNFTDWYQINAWKDKQWVPDSCCRQRADQCGETGDPSRWYKKGCLDEFKYWLTQNMYMVGVAAVSIGAIQILGMVAAIVLFCYLRNEDLYGDYDDYDP